MLQHFLFIFLWSLLLAFFLGGEMAFAFFNRLRLEIVNDDHFHNRIHSFFCKHSVQFSNVVFIAHFAVLFLLVRQVYLSVCSLPLLQAVWTALLALLLVVALAQVFMKLMEWFSATQVFIVMAYPLMAVYWLLLPVSKVLVFVASAGGMLKLDAGWLFSINRVHQVDDELAEHKDDVEAFGDEVTMVQNVLDFSNVKVKDSMVPRTELVAIDIDTPLNELRQLFVETHFSRILVYKGTVDNVLGYVHSADMFDNPQSVEQMLNPIIVVPETMPANSMLRLFLKQKKSLALVVDEFGGTSGILTIEDVMEEIFGEIEDEHDGEDDNELVSKKIGPNEYVISGRMEIEEVNSQLGLDLPAGDGYVTVGGLLLYRNAFLPAINDVVMVGERYAFKVVKLSPSHIDVVRLTVAEPASVINH